MGINIEGIVKSKFNGVKLKTLTAFQNIEGVSHENQEGSKAVSVERSSFKDVLAGSFLYFPSGFFFKSGKNYSASYKRNKLAFFS
jgi:hypothetical protein